MKKKFVTIITAILLVLTGVFALSACGCKEDDSSAVVTSISAELVNDKYEMVDNTITVEYGGKVDLRYNDFKVIANLDNDKTKEIPKKYGNSDGYVFQSSIPQSYSQTPVNNYTIIISYGDLEEIVITVKVIKADFSGSLDWNYTEPYLYDGEEKIVEIVDLPTGVTVVYEGVSSAIVVGNYTCTAIFTCTDSSNYKEIPSKTINWTILPAPIDVSAVEMMDKVYNETEQSAEIAVATLPSNVIVSDITGDTVAANVGVYTVTIIFSVTGDNAENYTVDSVTTTWEITKGTYIVTGGVEIDGQSTFIYNGQERTVAIDYTNLDNNVRVVGTPTGLTATNAGDYTVAINLEYVGNNNNYNTVAGTVTVDWKIEKAPLTITAKHHTITYGDVLSFNGIDEPVGFVADEDISVLNGELELNCEYEQFDPVGTYDIIASGYTADNYNITYELGDLVVVKKTLTIRPNDVTIEFNSGMLYNGVQIDGFVGDDTVEILEGELEYSCDYSIGSPVKDGGYIISISGYTADNYEIVYETGVLTVTKSTVDVSSVRLVDNEFVYNATVQTVAVDETTLPTGVTVSSIKMDSNNRETKSACEYTAVVSLSYIDSINYEPIPDVYLPWKIIKASVDISSFDILSNTIEYNGQLQYLEFTELPAGAIMVELSGDRGKDAGLYQCAVKIVCADRSNYNDFTEIKNFSWRIAPKELVVTANNHIIEYGMVGANAGVQYSGFAPGEDLSVFGGQIIYSYKKSGSGNYVAGSDAGTYIINISGSTLYNNNYNITYINGQLTVIVKVVDLNDYIARWQSETSREYDPTVAFTPKLTNVPDGVIATYTYIVNDGTNAVITAPIEIGSYIATVEFTVKNNNYNLMNYYGVEGIDFTITKRIINATTLVWNYPNGIEIEYSNISIKPTYANSVPGITVDYTYYKENESLEYEELPAEADIAEIGNYKVVASLSYDENNFDFVAPAETEIKYSIVKIAVTATALNWSVESVLDRREDDAIYYTAEVSHTGGYITTSLSRNEYLLVEYFDGEVYTTTPPKFIEKGEYFVVARVSIKDEYKDTYRLSTGGEYYTYNLVLGISQIIFNTLKIDDTDYELEELIDSVNMVRLGSKFYYSIRNFYALVRINYGVEDGWVIVENGFEFTDYFFMDNRYTFYVIDKSINPKLEMYTSETGVIYELKFDTYLIEDMIYGADDRVLHADKGLGAVYELGMDEDIFEITFDNESLALLDKYQFKYMIIDSEGEWLDPVDIVSMPLVFDNLSSIYCIMILVSFDQETNYQITQFVLIPPTHVKGYTVTSAEFGKDTVIVEEVGLGGWNKSICNGVVTGFTVHLKDEYANANYTIEYFSDANFTKPVNFTNIGIIYSVYYEIYDNTHQVVESGEFRMYHAFVPENLPQLCMNAVDPEDDTPYEYYIGVDSKLFTLSYNLLEGSGFDISQTYNGESSVELQDGTQVIDYVLTITYDDVTYIFEMPITVVCTLNIIDCFDQEYIDSYYYPVSYTTTNSETGEEETITYQIQRSIDTKTNYIDLTAEYNTKNILEFNSILSNLDFPFKEECQITNREIVVMNDRFYIKLTIDKTVASTNSVSSFSLPNSPGYYYIELLVKEADYLEFTVTVINSQTVSLETENFEERVYKDKTYLVVKCSDVLLSEDFHIVSIGIENLSTNLTERIYCSDTVVDSWKLFDVGEEILTIDGDFYGRCGIIDFDSNSKYGGVIIYFANSSDPIAPNEI